MGTTPPAPIDLRQRSLVALYEAHVDDVFRFCLARSGSEVVAEDATSEAFVAAARTFAAGRGDDVDRPWLFVVARRRMVDQWRSAERQRSRIERARRLAVTAQYEDPNDTSDDTSERVLEALRSLPARQRAAVTLRYLDECSVAETAEALGVEYRAAESLLARGRRGFTKAWAASTRRQDENA